MKNIYLVILCSFAPFLPCSFAQNVGVGITTPISKLHIKGSANIPQFTIDANSVQGNFFPLIRLRGSAGLDRLWIHSDTSFNSFVGLNAGRVNNAFGGGVNNSFIGMDAGFSNTMGNSNTAIGMSALRSNTTGNFNTANGKDALYTNSTGYDNTATGRGTLYFNTTGYSNTGSGTYALRNNTTGYYNSAHGSNALRSNTTGFNNTSDGYFALYSNTTGNWNTATGANALYTNTIGYHNTANGHLALNLNTSGNNNSATGNYSLYSNTTASNNSAHGYAALYANTTGASNTANGHSALYANTTGFNNTSVGFEALNTITTGNNNTAIGFAADVSGIDISNATAIGSKAYAGGSNSVVIGSINGVNGATASANVGIGTSTPNANLHVNGALKLVDGTQGAGKILTSNAAGLASWQPPPPPPPTYFESVSICCQSWMTRNLDVTTYRNGDPIPKVTDAAAWAALTTGAYCYYNNDSTTYAATYGKLYNWYAVNDSRRIAPQGWHIPTDFEWTTLGDCLGGASVAGGPMKEPGTTHWVSPNAGANNISGITGLPGGYRSSDGAFSSIGIICDWWSSTQTNTTNAWLRTLFFNDAVLGGGNNLKSLGFSVRCIRD